MMTKLSDALLHHIMEHYKDELEDIEAYNAFSKKAEEDGDPVAAYVLDMIRHDEYTHAKALRKMLWDHARHMMDGKTELEDKWRKAEATENH